MTASAELASMAPEDTVRARTRTAFVAAAYGDALGWPNESRGKASLKKPRTKPSPLLVSWQRRDGTPTMAHTEHIPAGTYSDDTQLIVSVARSYLRAGDDWWRHFTRTELPFWRLYQRGGGGATMRAARAWSEGKVPWESTAESYFDAGGNGVAMRVLPHVVRHIDSRDFLAVRNAVVLDGITTHGHPRALLGAIVFAFALWLLMRRRQPLRFGQLIDDTSTNEALWAAYPFDDPFVSHNLSAARWGQPKGYASLWDATIQEIHGLLDVVRSAIAEGAAFNDNPTLERLGALTVTRGSGTISAVAAMFLTSRYVTDPSQGVIEAAFAAGADTDTLGSMTATLLACVGEGEQLAHRAKDVQDHDFLVSLGTRLVEARHSTMGSSENPRIVTNPEATRWKKSLLRRKVGERIELLDGRSGRLTALDRRSERNLRISDVIVSTDDGQTLRIKNIERASDNQPMMFEERIARVTQTVEPAPPAAKYGSYAFAPELVLRCRDLDRTVWFYQALLGLRVYEDKRPRQDQVRIEGPFSFVPADSALEIQAQSMIELRLRVRGIEDLALTLSNERFAMEPYPRESGAGPAVSLRDPDGRTVILIGVR